MSEVHFDPAMPDLKKAKKVAYIKDADLQIHVPNVGDSSDLEKTHSFTSIMAQYMSDVNALQHDSDAEIQRLVAGETEDLHAVTMKMDEAKKSFQMMLQIRNRLEESYREIKGMQA